MKPVRATTDTRVVDKVHKRLANIERRLGTGAAGAGDGDHTFSINGLIGDLGILSAHKVTVASGQTKTLVAISQTGPSDGTGTLYFMRNGSYFDDTDLPITLADGDLITVDPTDHSDDAAYISGHFTIAAA